MINILSDVFLVVGGTFLMLGGLGILRMPDTFNRIQAGAKATTLGAFAILIGIALDNPEWTFKIILIIIFIAISSPIGSSVIAKASYRAKNIPDNLVQDDLKERGGEDDTN